MAKATSPSGDLIPLDKCYIDTPSGRITMKILPDISDSKSAGYNDEPIIGRSLPLKTFAAGENRSISWTAHFMVVTANDLQTNMNSLRLIESLVYPMTVNTGGAPYAPPPVCQLRCGSLLARESSVCAILKSYSVKFRTDVAWDETEYIPYQFDVDMTWEVVEDSTNLPGQERILTDGR